MKGRQEGVEGRGEKGRKKIQKLMGGSSGWGKPNKRDGSEISIG